MTTAFSIESFLIALKDTHFLRNTELKAILFYLRNLNYPLSKNKYTLQDGIFGGLSYTPSFCKPLSIMAEYDSDGFNVGAATKLWKHLSLNVFTREFKCISGGIRYECVLIH